MSHIVLTDGNGEHPWGNNVDMRDWVVKSLKLLASEATEQAAYLEKLDVPEIVDELALEFDDLAVLFDQQLQFGFLTESQVKALNAVDAAFDKMSGHANANLWTVDALHSKGEWRQIRELAKAALARFR